MDRWRRWEGEFRNALSAVPSALNDLTPVGDLESCRKQDTAICNQVRDREGRARRALAAVKDSFRARPAEATFDGSRVITQVQSLTITPR